MRKVTNEKIVLNGVTTAQKSAMERAGSFDHIIICISTGAGTTFPVFTVQGTLQGYDAPVPVVPATVASPTNRYVNLGFTDLDTNTSVAGSTGLTLTANTVKMIKVGIAGNFAGIEGLFTTLTGAFDCPTTVSWAGYALV